ncbi:MAG: tRNA (adenosine(37)-N6)-dimethylallyltransferase MiaA [Oscillospiraceae bacterium]|nr:tRNA (adenosine(37)-N6)-dimethylallyltransferase MiaA [Oscillospiraceae bacterium]
MPPLVLVITGPTATGKTALGVELSKKLNGEVVSADSMQIYEHMDIGTAKVTPEETKGIPHQMVGCVSPFEEYSAARYVEDAAPICDDILNRGKLPIIVGGTGLYIDSLLKGRTFAERGNAEVRSRISDEYDALGGEALYEKLKKIDPEAAARLHANDKKRIVRALEIFEVTGITISEHDRADRQIPPRFDAVKIALSFENREDLYARIDRRVDIMAEAGLVQEVKKLLDMGLNEKHTAMQAIGYKELVDAILHGSSINDALDKIKQESRRYAKRQLSWLRRDSEINWILHRKTPQIDEAVQLSTEFLNKHR